MSWEPPDFIPVGPKTLALFQKYWAQSDKEKTMAHHQDWRTRHMNTMREMKATGGLNGTSSAAGTKGRQIPTLDSEGLTRLAGTKEQGVKTYGKKVGGPS